MQIVLEAVIVEAIRSIKMTRQLLKGEQSYESSTTTLPKEELAQRGQALYESSIRQQVEAGNECKINEGK